jgi:hypothetical protein
MKCPKCNEECYRDEVDVMGPGYPKMTGPYGCPNCGWSEDPDYDLSGGKTSQTPSGTIDQYGGFTPS